MSLSGRCLPPSSSLPPVRSLRSATEIQLTSALCNLHALYCPLRLPAALSHPKPPASALVDSGYVSEDDDGGDDDELAAPDVEEENAAIRADAFERDFAVRWLTAVIARADELDFSSEDVRERALHDAAFVLASFSDAANDDAEEALTRHFSFPAPLSSPDAIRVRLNDAPLSGTDHTDVGLQSWGASIILSGLMCESPAQFGLERIASRSHCCPTVIELGAGTGLVSLALAKLLPCFSAIEPHVIATDYHPAVLDNLHSNITANFPADTSPHVQTALLDWSAPCLDAPLDVPADMLVAADVVYAREHAVWLRNCAGQMLALDGVFWLIVTVRQVGKFEGIADTVEVAFNSADECPAKDGRVLRIVGKEALEKRRGIGRGDETGYNLYRIAWV